MALEQIGAILVGGLIGWLAGAAIYVFYLRKRWNE